MLRKRRVKTLKATDNLLPVSGGNRAGWGHVGPAFALTMEDTE